MTDEVTAPAEPVTWLPPLTIKSSGYNTFGPRVKLDDVLEKIIDIINGEASELITQTEVAQLQGYAIKDLQESDGYIDPQYAEALPAQLVKIDGLIAALNAGVVPSVQDRKSVFETICKVRNQELGGNSPTMREVFAGLTKPTPQAQQGTASQPPFYA